MKFDPIIEVLSYISGQLLIPEQATLAQHLDLAVLDLQAMLTIQVNPKLEFGQHRMYPVNRLGLTLAELMRQQSFTLEDVQTLQELGYTFKPEYDATAFYALIKGDSK